MPSTPFTVKIDDEYPESDGKPMADNTLQLDWMLKIIGELRDQFVKQNVFVAGNLFWYPVKGQPSIVTAPDVFVAFGRPQTYRGSYKQWIEDDIAPQVVFEILSPSNSQEEMDDKVDFYDQHGVEEYYFIDPFEEYFIGYTRRKGRLTILHDRNGVGFVSPRLGIRLVSKEGFQIFTPDGREFQARDERVQELLDEFQRSQTDLATERERSELEFKRAEAATKRAEAERLEKERYAAKLRELGVDPASLR